MLSSWRVLAFSVVLAGCTALVELPTPAPGDEGGAGPGGSECTTDVDCAADDDECASSACVDDTCVSTPTPAGTPCDLGRRECDGEGSCNKLTLGQECTEASVCASELCVDDVCCASACGAAAACMACNVPGLEGTCSAIPLGDDPLSECDVTACNGRGACGGVVQNVVTFDADTFPNGLAVNDAGQVFITGTLSRSAEFGGDTLGDPASATNYFVVSLDTQLKHRWSGGNLAADQTGDQRGVRAAAFSDGSWIAAASYAGDFDVDGTPEELHGNRDIAIIRYNNSPPGEQAAVAWSISLGGTGHDYVNDVSVDENGDVIIAGSLTGTVDIGNGAEPTGTGLDQFVAKLDGTDGQLIWGKRFPTEGTADVFSLEVRGTEIYIVGYATSPIDYGGGALPIAGNNDITLAHLDGSGNHVGSRSFGTPGPEVGFDIAIDSTGAVILTGAFDTVIDFGGGTLTAIGGLDFFLVKLDADLEHVFSRAFGAVSAFLLGSRVAVDDLDNIVIAGGFHGNVDFGAGPVVNSGIADTFVVKYTPQGAYGWGRFFASTATERVSAVAATPDGVFAVGTFEGPVDFGGGVIDPTPDAHTFVLSLGH